MRTSLYCHTFVQHCIVTHVCNIVLSHMCASLPLYCVHMHTTSPLYCHTCGQHCHCFVTHAYNIGIVLSRMRTTFPLHCHTCIQHFHCIVTHAYNISIVLSHMRTTLPLYHDTCSQPLWLIVALPPNHPSAWTTPLHAWGFTTSPLHPNKSSHNESWEWCRWDSYFFLPLWLAGWHVVLLYIIDVVCAVCWRCACV